MNRLVLAISLFGLVSCGADDPTNSKESALRVGRLYLCPHSAYCPWSGTDPYPFPELYYDTIIKQTCRFKQTMVLGMPACQMRCFPGVSVKKVCGKKCPGGTGGNMVGYMTDKIEPGINGRYVTYSYQGICGSDTETLHLMQKSTSICMSWAEDCVTRKRLPIYTGHVYGITNSDVAPASPTDIAP